MFLSRCVRVIKLKIIFFRYDSTSKISLHYRSLGGLKEKKYSRLSNMKFYHYIKINYLMVSSIYFFISKILLKNFIILILKKKLSLAAMTLDYRHDRSSHNPLVIQLMTRNVIKEDAKAMRVNWAKLGWSLNVYSALNMDVHKPLDARTSV